MIDLGNTTLWSCVWSDDKKLLNRTIHTLCYCQSLCDFGEVVLFSKVDPGCDCCGWKVLPVPAMDLKGWSKFVNFEVPKFINTDYAMSVHEDGFILDPSMWTPEFFGYDYIGAPWPDHVVGNGGFNIESKKLLQAKMTLPKNDDPSDVFVCRTHRNTLRQGGCRFAPEDLAFKFSTEQTGHDKKSFGFHGRTAIPHKYATGWKQIRDYYDCNVEIVYIYVAKHPTYEHYAKRFVQSYLENQPGEPHSTTIVCNCGLPDDEMKKLFGLLPNVNYIVHDNTGRDIGGFQVAAKQSKADLIVFFGASTYYCGKNWLTRIVDSYMSYGEGLFGTMGNLGTKFHGVRSDVFPHIRTTAFWTSPELMNEYPLNINRQELRYEFEHGKNCLTEWVRKQNLPAMVVNWNGEYGWPAWNNSPHGFHRGNQSDLMIGDHISGPEFYKPK